MPSRRLRYIQHPSLGLLFAVLLTTQIQALTTTNPPSSHVSEMTGKIGDSVLLLTGPWKFHPGDNPQWAAPDFNDFAWDDIDLTPPPGSYDPNIGSTGFVPGWTARGYPNLVGYAWYRLRIKVESTGLSSLSLKMPQNVDDAYQIFVNGHLIGQFGKFAPNHVTVYGTQPRAFRLPSGTGGKPMSIAIRMWMSSASPFMAQETGGLHGPPLLGESSAIEAMLRLDWNDVDLALAPTRNNLAFLFLASLLGLTLFILERKEPGYLWLAISAAATLASGIITLLGWLTELIPLGPEFFIQDVILGPLSFAMWVVFWGYWFRIDRMHLLHRVVWTLALFTMIGISMLRVPLYGTIVPVQASAWLLPVTMGLKLLLGVVLLWVAYHGIRKAGLEGWLALPALLFLILRQYSYEFQSSGIPVILHIFGYVLNVSQIAVTLMIIILSALLLHRFFQGQRESLLLRVEVEQARHVQQVLIPEELPQIPGFVLESEYRPAQQVGGDFFQILRVNDGSVLLAVGDVSGKGMPAAMTVSLLVGTLRTLAHFSDSPGKILGAMNTQMVGRSQGGFTTCLVLRADPDGTLTVANAGHPAPYLEGRELVVSTGLPLGLETGSTYSESTLHLSENEKLTLISDGVVEARNKTGELFGFDRATRLSKGSARCIADAAQIFGQQDDITVVSLTRLSMSGPSRSSSDTFSTLPSAAGMLR